MFFEKREVKTLHTLAIWTLTFHKKSGCVKVIWKANFKPAYRPELWTFLSENSGVLYSFYFFFLQKLSNPLFFTVLLLFQKGWNTWVKSLHQITNRSTHWNSSNSVQKTVDLTNSAKNRRKMRIINVNFQIKKNYNPGIQACLKLAFKITLAKPDILWNVNIQIATVCARLIPERN